MPAPFGIYVHAPWCRVRCPYCAFNVYPDREADWSAWADGLRAEWALRRDAFPGLAHSLYFGGGTPSLAPPALIGALVDALPLEPAAEVSLEVNPGTLDPAGMDALIAGGVNRLSLGIQTFNPRFAHLLNRGHSVDQARALVAQVAALPLRSWSLDLIFALPGQTLADVDADLDAVLEARPPHVSLYGLTFEEGTPFGRALTTGRMKAPDEALWRAAYDRIRQRLQEGGWQRYEVSNFALPGHRAQHNEAVWRGGFYAGLGPGAHGFQPDGARSLNHGAVADWLADPEGALERPDSHEAAADRVLSSLRHVDGLDLNLLQNELEHSIPDASLTSLFAAGLVERGGAGLRLTEAGVPLADGVVRHLCAALQPIGPSGTGAPG